jgi:hypothetical protein
VYIYIIIYDKMCLYIILCAVEDKKKKIVFINGNVNVLYANCSGSNVRACISSPSYVSYTRVCVRCARVGSRPGPLVLSMNFIDGGDGSAIRVGYASMNAPQSPAAVVVVIVAVAVFAIGGFSFRAVASCVYFILSFTIVRRRLFNA